MPEMTKFVDFVWSMLACTIKLYKDVYNGGIRMSKDSVKETAPALQG